MHVIKSTEADGRPPQPESAGTALRYPTVLLIMAVFVFIAWLMSQGFQAYQALLIAGAGVAVGGGLAWLPRTALAVLRWIGRSV